LNLNCVIVDDEPMARNLMSEYIKKVPSLNLVDTCSNALAAINVLQNKQVDLLFLDIQMPEISGLSFLKTLQKKPMVILTTAYSEYALESYELDVIDYLLKPITLERFLKAVDKAGQRFTNPEPVTYEKGESEPSQTFIFVKDGTKLVKIRWKDILYIEGMKDYVAIHTPHQKIVTLQRLKSLEVQLPTERFIRIHHSYIVSVESIDAIHKDKVQIGKTFLPISDSYKKQFKEFIDRRHIQPE
jgi:two-component system, LytTR family, response regulator